MLATSGYLDSFTQSDCMLLAETEMTLSTSGISGATLSPVLLTGIEAGFTIGTLFAVESNDRSFEWPWYAISSLVKDSNGDEVGVATWLSPHLLAVWSGAQSGIAIEDWAESPDLYPEQTYIYAANRLAADVSVWRPAAVRAAAEAPSRRCVQTSRTTVSVRVGDR